MADPDFYPHAVHDLQRADTHISIVFLTGQWVYKLKKPVYLDFLDFRQLTQRKTCCEQEVILNQRLSHDVYDGVVAIFQHEDGTFSLDPDGPNGSVAEYAVKMRQLRASDSLKALLRNGAVDGRQIETLAKTLTSFYRQGLQGPDIDRFGHPETIAYNMEENFRQLDPFVGNLFPKEPWDFLCQVSRSFLEHHRDVFDRRVSEGHVRDGHGDLRTDHVYFDRGVQIIDCIEFNDRFRYGDAAVDLAFLYMDMDHLEKTEWSRFFLSSYVRQSGDVQLYTVIDFYAAYRALVRLKVDAFRYKEASSSDREHLKRDVGLYFEQAYRYAVQFGRPTLWILCGLPATGKSSLGEALSKVLSLKCFQSDQLRKAADRPGDVKTAAFDSGPYRLQRRQQVYAELLGRGHDTLKDGHSVILDATFSRQKWREEAQRLADDLDCNLIFVETVCTEETIRDRLKVREKAPGLSDARLDHLPDMIRSFEALEELPDITYFQISSDHPLESMLMETLSKGFECTYNQVNRLLEARGQVEVL
jgi:aminoglycoside phosphotransferase family enzyme/predicted kinase